MELTFYLNQKRYEQDAKETKRAHISAISTSYERVEFFRTCRKTVLTLSYYSMHGAQDHLVLNGFLPQNVFEIWFLDLCLIFPKRCDFASDLSANQREMTKQYTLAYIGL